MTSYYEAVTLVCYSCLAYQKSGPRWKGWHLSRFSGVCGANPTYKGNKWFLKKVLEVKSKKSCNLLVNSCKLLFLTENIYEFPVDHIISQHLQYF